ERLTKIKQDISEYKQIEVLIETDAIKPISNSDVIVNINGLPMDYMRAENFKPNSIVCNFSLPKNIESQMNLSGDVTFVNAGLIKLPFKFEFSLYDSLPSDIVSASLAETLLLTFESRFVNYSIGENINLDKLDEIADIAARYGF
ncbi:MAG: hypothetical protein NC908_04880, partial [Candidatus Omnitrophica bacterium]|nr:hypothetical protein [Candidatus Omnitrophota bacterium]